MCNHMEKDMQKQSAEGRDQRQQEEAEEEGMFDSLGQEPRHKML